MIRKFGPTTKLGWAILIAPFVSKSSQAQFVPGHVFVTEPTNDFCKDYPNEPEYIWEIDPLTGGFSLFAEIPGELCGSTSGMAFSPDGKRLRVSSYLNNAILEFDAQANLTIALDYYDGILAPEGCNNIAFDQEGNFYIPSNSNTSAVLKFPPDGGPAIALGEPIGRNVSLAVAPDGDIYVGVFPGCCGNHVVRITQSGEKSVFDVFDGLNEAPISIAIDDLENVYVLTSSASRKLYAYTGGDADSREILATCSQTSPGICTPLTLAMSPDQSQLYLMAVNSYRLMSIDFDGTFDVLASGPALSLCGMAVVPLRGDVNGDQMADLDDYQVMAQCIGMNHEVGNCAVADLDLDGDVDFFDFRFFQWAFGGPR